MCRFICLCSMFFCWVLSAAQERYDFTCDCYEGDSKKYSNLKGSILVDKDAFSGKFCLLVTVKNPQRRGRLPFGFSTDPEAGNPKLTYYPTFPYDEDLKDVYSVISDGFELMVFVKYSNGLPDQIVMSEKDSNNKSVYITMPYNSADYNGIYNVIKNSRNKIRYIMQ